MRAVCLLVNAPTCPALQIQGEDVCDTGLDEPELHWKEEQDAVRAKRLEACKAIKSTFQRTARASKDVLFLEMQVRGPASPGLRVH